MTLREVIATSFGREPDKKTTQNNLSNIEKIKKNVDTKTKQELDAIAAELKAHKQAKQVSQSVETTAQVSDASETAQEKENDKTAE